MTLCLLKVVSFDNLKQTPHLLSFCCLIMTAFVSSLNFFFESNLYLLPITYWVVTSSSCDHWFQSNLPSHTLFPWKEVKEQVFLMSELSPVNVLDTQTTVGTLLLKWTFARTCIFKGKPHKLVFLTAQLLLPVCHVWLHHFHTHSFSGQLNAAPLVSPLFYLSTKVPRLLTFPLTSTSILPSTAASCSLATPLAKAAV